MTKQTYREITGEERDALQRFADSHDNMKGPSGHRMPWRDHLAHVYWYNARVWARGMPGDGEALHRLRNDLGPTWLYDVCDVNAEKQLDMRKAVQS